jgi:hypothetical protein
MFQLNLKTKIVLKNNKSLKNHRIDKAKIQFLILIFDLYLFIY